ncbi:peptidoglycan editing factor PgeF [Microvirga arsenatis]|uniref:Purine nucleoside phosphorylase n=1 Tax=Microvirga arsenatis TaxID=2692265 RepID=A0ABW9Z1H3_9HYPH|nr:peptidoglycan editing factor PgeF [Microvirga arsenatis]NBJ12735.1 peptidoglycan editing factor PgeF [Microvirga arsenatis]NBJ26517.1 peptidoglycan editing factor PgeF [Microvirga arsenatis]
MFIQAPALSSQPHVRHAFFTRQGGVSEGIYASLNGGVGSADDPSRVQENRRRMAAALDVAPDALVSVYQVHSPDAVIVEGPWRGERPRADAMVTGVPGLALGITTADCGPVLFADAEARVIGAAHAGWRGAVTGILEATLDAMERLGARRGNVVAVLGPTISRKAYEVGPDFIDRFTKEAPGYERFLSEGARPGHAMFDLPGFIGARLAAASIGAFADLGLCTYSDEERFFSYRRTTHRKEPDYGRLISAIALTP